jgi:hypothetical protein
MDLPHTLYGQLYLLAYDRRRRRFDYGKLWLLGYALRAATLTELFMTGYLQDVDGMARRAGGWPPNDPVFRATLEAIDVDEPKPWARLVVDNEKDANRLVRDQLENHGWICQQRRRRLGLIPTRCHAPIDEAAVLTLADRTTKALRNAVDGRSAEPRTLMLGLLAVLGELPALLGDKELAEHRERLHELALAAAGPIAGMREAVEAVYAEMGGNRNGDNNSGCGGCGGGCGGCGGCGG